MPLPTTGPLSSTSLVVPSAGIISDPVVHLAAHLITALSAAMALFLPSFFATGIASSVALAAAPIGMGLLSMLISHANISGPNRNTAALIDGLLTTIAPSVMAHDDVLLHGDV